MVRLQERFPILESLSIEVVDDPAFEGGRFCLPESEEEGSRIHMAFGSERDFENLKQTREQAVRLMAEQLGVAFDQIDGEQIRQFIFFHEIGHAYDFLTNFGMDMDFESAASIWMANSEFQLGQLPYPSLSPAELREQIFDGGGFDQWLAQDEKRKELCRKLNVHSERQLVTLQENAYRQLDKERFADVFARNAMQQLKR
ncbi:hypothetical protein HY626_01495 [Candidatus Uhrbacteria bacterium]|nr:hypothetical protein [Candidatus Uhrbacteria bacterium]